MKALSFLLLSALALTSTAYGETPAVGQKESGLGAVYSSRLNGHVTSSGQIYNPDLETAAHKSLPYGTKIKVTNPKNHRHTTVLINDRGPVQSGRILDLSPSAAHQLGIPGNSMRPVELEVITVGSGRTTRQGSR